MFGPVSIVLPTFSKDAGCCSSVRLYLVNFVVEEGLLTDVTSYI